MKKWFKKRDRHAVPNEGPFMITEAGKTDEERKLEALETRVKQLECSHTSGWYYRKPKGPETSIKGWTYTLHPPQPHRKVCQDCAKVVPMEEEQWLQEQADEAYKKHEQMVEQINELNKEEK